MGKNEEVSSLEVGAGSLLEEQSDLNIPIKINGWDEHDGPEDHNPPGKQCFKKYFSAKKLVYGAERHCEIVQEESCGTTFVTEFRAVQVNTNKLH